MKKAKLLQFNVIYEIDEDGYFIASVPSIPGCYTQGKTFEEAKTRIAEAVEVCIKEEPEYKYEPQTKFMGIGQVVLHDA